MTSAAELAQRLNARRSGDGWLTQCPAHEDRKPSLSINEGTDGKLLLHCHAGCSFEDIRNAVGLETPRTSAIKTINTPSAIVKTYDFTDEAGTLLFQEIRYEPKDFKQRRPDGLGGWVWNLKDVELTLYNLPKIKDASDVFIVEGPKDAESLKSLGYTATTAPLGAGKWKSKYSELLRGKDIYIIPDNDVAGHKHAQDVAQSLHGVAKSVKIVKLPELPEKGDVSDFIEIHGPEVASEKISNLAASTTELTPLLNTVAAAPDHRFKLVLAGDIKATPPRWVVRDVLEEYALALVFGDPGCAKSFWALDLALCISTGTPHHGHAVQQGPVIYIAGEGQNGIKRRLMAWSKARGIEHNDAPLLISLIPTALTDEDAMEAVLVAIDEATKRVGMPRVVIIDTLARNYGPGDENSTSDMSKAISAADTIRARYQTTILFVHHTGHADKSRARGAMALKGALDAEYRMDKDETGIIRLEATKMKEAEHPEPMAFQLRSVDLDLIDLDTGEVVTSAALELTSYEPRAVKGKKGRGKWQTRAQEVLLNLWSERRDRDGEASRVSLDEWKVALKDAGIPRQRITEVTTSLIEVKAVHESHGFITPIF